MHLQQMTRASCIMSLSIKFFLSIGLMVTLSLIQMARFMVFKDTSVGAATDHLTDHADVKSAKDSNIEDDIRIQRKIFADQMRERAAMNRGRVPVGQLVYAIVPQIVCPTMVRIGDVADGGKWVCNIWRLKSSDCVVYSLGVGGNPTFERDVLKYSACTVHSFDPDQSFAGLFKAMEPRVQFHPWKIMGNDSATDKNELSFSTVASRLGHKQVDILKMDIEDWEFVVIPGILADSLRPAICQLLVESHGNNGLAWSALIKRLEKSGFLLFSREVNSYCGVGPNTCMEYSFIQKSCLSSFGLSEDNVLLMNFE